MALTLYHAPASFFSQRTRFAFAEKKVEYKRVEVEIFGQEQLQPWYVRIQPLMTVPALAVEGGTTFIDSEAIIGFVDQITPELSPLFPDEKTPEGQKCSHFLQLFKTFSIEVITSGTCMDPQYTQGFTSFMSTGAVEKSINSGVSTARRYSEKYADLRYEYLNKVTALLQRLAKLKADNALRNELDAMDSALTEVEAELAKVDKEHEDMPSEEKPWLCGKQFTVADIYFATILHRLISVGYSHYWTNGKRPSVEKYYQRVLQRESFCKSCLHGNNLFWSIIVPMMRYKIRCALPWFLGAFVAAVSVYIYHRKH